MKDREPSLDVVVLEAEECGFGASGRNGGFASAWWDELPEMARAFGEEQALFLADACAAAVDEIGRFCEAEGIDCHSRRAGYLWTAAAPAQLGAYDEAVHACAELGRAEELVPVDGEECRRRIGSPLLLGGAFMRAAAAVQPALLVRGLRRSALARGVRIHERTHARGLGPPVETPAGRLEARAVVLAANAWAARWHPLRRAILPVASHVVVTEPVPDELERMGWTGGELWCDGRLLVHYAQVTRDGRVALGRGGGAVGPAGRVTAAMHRDERAAASITGSLRRLFPELAGARIDATWGGPIDRVPGHLHLPFFGRIAPHVVYGAGFSGNGVAPSRVAGRILASLALDADDEWARCALARGPRAFLPPEPLRTAGALAVRRAVRRKEEIEELGGHAGWVTGSLAGLAGFALRR